MTTIPQDPLPSSSSKRIAFSSIEEKANDCCPDIFRVGDVRDEIFHLGAIVGRLCTFFLSDNHPSSLQQCDINSINGGEHSTKRVWSSFWWEEEEDLPPSSSSDEVLKAAAHRQLGEVFIQLFVVAGGMGIDVCTSILKKIELNGRKYPVELCRVCTYVVVCIIVLKTS